MGKQGKRIDWYDTLYRVNMERLRSDRSPFGSVQTMLTGLRQEMGACDRVANFLGISDYALRIKMVALHVPRTRVHSKITPALLRKVLSKPKMGTGKLAKLVGVHRTTITRIRRNHGNEDHNRVRKDVPDQTLRERPRLHGG